MCGLIVLCYSYKNLGRQILWDIIYLCLYFILSVQIILILLLLLLCKMCISDANYHYIIYCYSLLKLKDQVTNYLTNKSFGCPDSLSGIVQLKCVELKVRIHTKFLILDNFYMQS